jgi:hypothetical protein
MIIVASLTIGVFRLPNVPDIQVRQSLTVSEMFRIADGKAKRSLKLNVLNDLCACVFQILNAESDSLVNLCPVDLSISLFF